MLADHGLHPSARPARDRRPPGAACLGRALRALGAEVTYVTDAVALPAARRPRSKVLGEPAADADLPTPRRRPAGAARRPRAGSWPSTGPTHLVSIERPGRARDGEYRSARGQSLTEWNGPSTSCSWPRPPAPSRSASATAATRSAWARCTLGWRARAPSSAPSPRWSAVRHLVVAGVSNWGAYGVVAELARLAGRPLLHTAEEEQAMVRACVDAGAVDGLTRRAEPTVDGLPLAGPYRHA